MEDVELIISVGDKHVQVQVDPELMRNSSRDRDIWIRYFLPALYALRNIEAFE